MKKYLDVTLVTKGGIKAKNPLKLSEESQLLPLIYNNRAVTVKVVEISDSDYYKIFRE